MSIQAVDWVLQHSEATGSARLVMFSLANHANPYGASCTPSLDLIAYEARLSVPAVVRALAVLERDGEILAQRRRGRGNVNRYLLVMGRDPAAIAHLFNDPENLTERKVLAAQKGNKKGNAPSGFPAKKGNEKHNEKPITALGEPLNHLTADDEVGSEREGEGGNASPSRPLANRPIRPVPKPTTNAQNDDSGVSVPQPLPDDFAVTAAMRDRVTKAGVPGEVIDRETAKFRAYYRERQKTSVDWPAKWEYWVLRFDQIPAGTGQGATGARASPATGRRGNGSYGRAMDRLLEIANGGDDESH